MVFSLSRPVFLIFAALLLVAVIVAGWGLAGPEHDVLADAVGGWLERVRGTPWTLPAVCALYLILGAVLFPVTVLNLAMAMVFGALWGVVYGLAGSLLSAALYFVLGRVGRRRHFARLLELPKVRRVDRSLQNGGVGGVALLRLVPIAPFTVFNLAAGVSSIRFVDYIAGSFLALLPGALARGIVGDSLMQLFLHPEAGALLWLSAGLGLWVAAIAGSHSLLKRYRRPQEKS